MITGNAIHARDLSVATEKGRALISGISFSVPHGAFVTVVGLSGCGKSTLIRTLAGILQPVNGEILYSGHPIRDIKDHYPLAVGYIPQFGTFHGELTVREILQNASALRLPRSVSPETRQNWLQHIIALARIESLLDQKYATLSGGQMRRIALAEELVGDPAFLLLDELTTGLDVFSDAEIMAWLRELAHEHGKTIILVTHATEHLQASDAILFLHGGRLLHYGDYPSLLAANGVNSVEELFGKIIRAGSSLAIEESNFRPEPSEPPTPEPLRTAPPPNGWAQFPTLVARQATLFFRDKGQLLIQLALIITFPLLVAIFAMDGLPQVRSLALDSPNNLVRSLEDRLHYLKDATESASLISGLVMFQVVLLTLIAANNGAREVARERDILRKELFAGLSPAACIGAKFAQLVLLCFVQTFWMAWFVKTVCGFPGSLIEQFGILFATTLAMSTTCLAISAAVPSAERASLLSIYLVGFQLPLSGAALALPGWLADLCRPFIAAYWGWSGYLRTLDSTRYFGLVTDATKTRIAGYETSLVVLGIHISICLVAAHFFLQRLRRSST